MAHHDDHALSRCSARLCLVRGEASKDTYGAFGSEARLLASAAVDGHWSSATVSLAAGSVVPFRLACGFGVRFVWMDETAPTKHSGERIAGALQEIGFPLNNSALDTAPGATSAPAAS